MPEEEKQFRIQGAEQVYDAFDEFEHLNILDTITVMARSLEEAVEHGNTHFSAKINKQRSEGGYMSSGMFFGYAHKVYDSDNNLVYWNKDRDNDAD